MTVDDEPGGGGGLVRRVCRSVYRALLVAYPEEFRAAHGDEAADVFAEACCESWKAGGARPVIRRLAFAVVDVPRSGLAERRSNARAQAPATRASMFSALVGDVRHALRSIRRRPGLAVAIVGTLALGIGANTAMFSVIDATLLRPLPYAHADRVVYLQMRDAATGATRYLTVEELERWAPQLQLLERVEGETSKTVLLTGSGGSTHVVLFEATTGYFGLLRTGPIAGRLLGPTDAEPGAVPVTILSEHLWRGLYNARTDIIGASIVVDGITRVVVGVAPEIPSDVPGARFDLSAPLPEGGQAATDVTVRGVAWLKPGVSLAAARAEFEVVSATAAADGHRWVGDLEGPRNIFWNARQFRDSEIALMVAAFLLLAIAGINVANLLLAGGQVRRAEFAVRRALGAGRVRLVRLLLVESLVLGVAGCAAGILLAWTAVRLFTAIDAGPQLQTRLESVHLDGFVLGYAVAISLLTAVAFGIIPALRGAATPPGAGLRESDARTASRLRGLPGTVIGVEVGLSMVLLVVAGLVGRSYLQMRLVDPGFAADRVLSVHIELPENLYSTPERQAAFFDALVSDAARLPGVTGATIGYGATPPADLIYVGGMQAESRADQTVQIQASQSFVTPGYFKLMGIPLLAGADFQAADLRNAESSVEVPAVISRSFARRFWPDGNPLGGDFSLVEPNRTRHYRVVGVVGDVWGSVRGGQIYAPLVSKRWFTEVLLRIADGSRPPIAGLRAAITRIDPQVPADEDLWTAAEKLYDFIHIPRFQAALFAVFAGLALVLVAVGLAAVIAHAVSQRTREMGIRLALGARPSQVRGLVVTQGMRPAMIGLGLGLLVSLAVTRTMTAFLHGLSPTDPATLAGASVVLLGVALGAVLVPALRATRVDPVEALRSE